MSTLQRHWITALTLVAAGFLAIVGLGVLSGDDGIEAWRVAYTTTSLIGALAIVGGLWGLRTGTLRPLVANALVVVGVTVLGVGYWWFVFVPPVIAVMVLYAGVIRHGLERELRPS